MIMRLSILPLTILLTAGDLSAQEIGPEVNSWILNPGSETGYAGILTNVQQVQYGEANVYVSCTCIPGYDIGPWTGNPNTPANQDFVFKITRTPAENSGAPINTPLGHIGVWRNGVSIFNAKDAMSYQNQGVWNQNAIVVEGPSFDMCNGHPAPNGEYHHHLNPNCLYDDQNDEQHSPIIGYAFDGFPIYGAYGYANADGTGGIARMNSSYRLRDITERHTLPDGTALGAGQYGPAIAPPYVLGYYIEDYEFVPALGHLDEHNGRFCITPGYPEGTYAYFTTLDENGTATYPYVLGPTYFGTVPAGNTGPQSGHNTVTEPVLIWDGVSAVDELSASVDLEVFPVPSTGTVRFTWESWSTVRVVVLDDLGRTVLTQRSGSSNGSVELDLSLLDNGGYVVLASDGTRKRSCRVVLAR